MATKLSFSNSKGFTLVEVLMALAVFSFFIVVFMSTQGYNITTSTRMKNDLEMHNIAEYKINEAILNLPALNDSRPEIIEEKNFEETKWAHFSYKLEYRKLELPDFNKLLPEDENANETAEDNQNETLQKKIFEKLKTNMEKMLWQVQVTIIEKESGTEYTLSSWIQNPAAKIDLNLSL